MRLPRTPMQSKDHEKSCMASQRSCTHASASPPTLAALCTPQRASQPSLGCRRASGCRDPTATVNQKTADSEKPVSQRLTVTTAQRNYHALGGSLLNGPCLWTRPRCSTDPYGQLLPAPAPEQGRTPPREKICVRVGKLTGGSLRILTALA